MDKLKLICKIEFYAKFILQDLIFENKIIEILRWIFFVEKNGSKIVDRFIDCIVCYDTVGLCPNRM